MPTKLYCLRGQLPGHWRGVEHSHILSCKSCFINAVARSGQSLCSKLEFFTLYEQLCGEGGMCVVRTHCHKNI
eukprot:458576-Pelagomonas_calceolata.AAC.3